MILYIKNWGLGIGDWGLPYTENDVIKFTKPVRDNYKELENIIKEEGYESLFNDSYILSGIAKNLKK